MGPNGTVTHQPWSSTSTVNPENANLAIPYAQYKYPHISFKGEQDVLLGSATADWYTPPSDIVETSPGKWTSGKYSKTDTPYVYGEPEFMAQPVMDPMSIPNFEAQYGQSVGYKEGLQNQPKSEDSLRASLSYFS